MRVNTVSLKLGVRIDRAEARDGNIIMSGFAGTMPCETIVTPAEALQMARLCLKTSIISLIVRAMFARKSPPAS
jgi:hypothetical protein